MAYVDRYSPEQRRRLDARPGITGWAQVNGRNALSWPDKLALDVWYVDHASPRVDVDILLRTIRSVVKRDGVSAEGHATMPEFMGQT
jgi:lipopolysaccharide/colanic/teichoic acid biosynthesis glycosyltransferase